MMTWGLQPGCRMLMFTWFVGPPISLGQFHADFFGKPWRGLVSGPLDLGSIMHRGGQGQKFSDSSALKPSAIAATSVATNIMIFPNIAIGSDTSNIDQHTIGKYLYHVHLATLSP